MKLDLNKLFMGLDEKPLEGPTMAKQLATMISQKSNPIDPIKAFDWAIDLWKNKAIEIDNSDKKLLEDFLNSQDSISTLAKAQLLKELFNLK